MHLENDAILQAYDIYQSSSSSITFPTLVVEMDYPLSVLTVWEGMDSVPEDLMGSRTPPAHIEFIFRDDVRQFYGNDSELGTLCHDSLSILQF